MDYHSHLSGTDQVVVSPTQNTRSARILDCLRALKYQTNGGSIPYYMNVALENGEIDSASHMATKIAVAQLKIAQAHQAQTLSVSNYPTLLDMFGQPPRRISSESSIVHPGLNAFEVAALIQQRSLSNIYSAEPISQSVSESNIDNASIVSNENLDNSSTDRSLKSTTLKYIENIGVNDILCGRGGRSNHHSGNKRYRLVVARMKYMYQQCAAKTMKTDLSRAIVNHCSSYGARFVKLDETNGKYYVLSNAEARKKTSQALRESKALKWIN
jgi:hypothetical protein